MRIGRLKVARPGRPWRLWDWFEWLPSDAELLRREIAELRATINQNGAIVVSALRDVGNQIEAMADDAQDREEDAIQRAMFWGDD